MKSVKRLFLHDICEELNLRQTCLPFSFFLKTIVSHMPAPRKILRSNDGTVFHLSLFLFLFFLLGVDTHLKVASIPSHRLAEVF
jgi:hypothetical protein